MIIAPPKAIKSKANGFPFKLCLSRLLLRRRREVLLGLDLSRSLVSVGCGWTLRRNRDSNGRLRAATGFLPWGTIDWKSDNELSALAGL